MEGEGDAVADEDRRLLLAIADGDEAAMEIFYRQYEGRLFRFITGKISDSFAAADVLNEVMLAVWRSAASFEGRANVSSWVFGIAYRKVMDRYRKQPKESLVDEMPEQIDDSQNPFDAAATKDLRVHINNCLDGLSMVHRAVIELTFFEEMTYQEIASTLDCPEGTVKTRAMHAKRLLKNCLSTKLENVQ